MWTPSRDPAKGPRARDAVPSLFDTCVGIVVEHLDCVETLWGLPEPLKVVGTAFAYCCCLSRACFPLYTCAHYLSPQVQLAMVACARRKLTPDTVPLFTEHSPSEVVLLDCSALDKPHLLELLGLVLTTR